MTEAQAYALIERIQAEEPSITVTFDDSSARKGYGYCVTLELKSRQRRIIHLNYASEWPGIREAWHWFLHPDEELEEPKPTQKYFVEGIVMSIFRRKDGYWFGQYQQDGKTVKKYFGKADPRGRYPLCKEKEEVKTA